MSNYRFPTYFLSHGGGPWPYMKDHLGSQYDQLELSLNSIPSQLRIQPQAILVISGHWEEEEFAVQAASNPTMVYDYYGFPEYTYRVSYPAVGHPVLAKSIKELLDVGGIRSNLNDMRGYDHGCFCILQPMFPDAAIPVIQLSIRSDLDPGAHIAVGRLLAPLRDKGVLIIGSGFTYHNLPHFAATGKVPSKLFDTWLRETLSLRPKLRTERLVNWSTAPAARLAHPREDHLLPLMVALGAAEVEPATMIYHQNDLYGFITSSSYRFGNGAEYLE